MMIINKPPELEKVQCYKCKSVFYMHPFQDINCAFATECSLHECKHEEELREVK
jgi:hypothetical protein